jgi:hypothetical protein
MTEAARTTAAGWISLLAAGVLLLAAARARRQSIRIALGVLTTVVLVIGGTLFWYTHRPLPAPMHETLFQGIEYIRDVRSEPRPLVIHVVRIDLDTPGLRFFVTPVGENIPAQTVSQFVAQYHLQLAINADYFEPWRDTFPWDYYPHVGDPVNTRGLAASEGTVFTQGFAGAGNYDTLYLSADNHVSFDTPNGAIYNAVSGLPFLLSGGKSLVGGEDSVGYNTELHPRTAVGVDRTERTLILMLVDGRQPNYSEGVSLGELADLLLEYGAYHAINLDGGGSSTLVIEGTDGAPLVLNSPIHGRIPGRERPIANQLGVYAPALQ